MTPQDQTQFAGQGAGGNCVQASVASILDLALNEVPHFLAVAATPNQWELAFEDWLEQQGFAVWREQGEYLFEGYCLCSGPSPRGVGHMVVYRNGRLAHDPHPSRAGIESVHWTRMLVPLDPSLSKVAI